MPPLPRRVGRGGSGCDRPVLPWSRLYVQDGPPPIWMANPLGRPAPARLGTNACRSETWSRLLWTAALDGWMLSMMAIGVELERVRRKSGGRIHLTPHVPETGTVVSLCNQSLTEGTYERTEAEADCRNCLRRRDDPARVSSAFFQSDVGSELLERSLEQARTRRATQHATEQAPASAAASQPASPPQPSPAAARPSPPVAQPVPAIPELRSRTQLRKTFENVFTSPQGVILRISRDGSVDHMTFEGPVDIRRRGGVVTVRAGDVVLELGGG